MTVPGSTTRRQPATNHRLTFALANIKEVLPVPADPGYGHP